MNSPNLITPWQSGLTLCPPLVKGGRVVVMVVAVDIHVVYNIVYT